MATLTYQQSRVNGVALNFVAASAGGDAIKAEGGLVLVRNADSTSTTVTVVTPGTDQYDSARPDVAVVVAAGATTAIGPFPRDLTDPTTKLVGLTYSKVTSLTVAAVAG